MLLDKYIKSNRKLNMDKVALWLSNTITPEAALYEFEETILPKIHDTKKLLKRKIEDPALEKDIDKFFTDIDRLAHTLIHAWNKKLDLVPHI